jgi:hypothetical protein
MKPEELLDSISSRQSFLQFLEALLEDRCNSRDGWENKSIESFLEAMHAWAVDSNSLPEQPDWRYIAQLLLAGKHYE